MLLLVAIQLTPQGNRVVPAQGFPDVTLAASLFLVVTEPALFHATVFVAWKGIISASFSLNAGCDVYVDGENSTDGEEEAEVRQGFCDLCHQRHDTAVVAAQCSLIFTTNVFHNL